MTSGQTPEDADRRVRRTYERIGRHFAKTRPNPWDEVHRFLDGRSGRIGLDIGIGNGRHAELLTDHTERVIGIDVSDTLLEEARRRATDRGFSLALCLANAADLPIASDTVDLGVYIATLHHITPRERRIRSLDELARVLTPDGAAIVSAWSVTHDRFDRTSGFDTTVDWTLPDGETVSRFYHIYDIREFRDDLSTSRVSTYESFVSAGNCYAVIGGT